MGGDFPNIDSDGKNNQAMLGDHPGTPDTVGAELVGLTQTFNCENADEAEPERFCTIVFDADYTVPAGVNEQAAVTVINAIGAISARIPRGEGRYTLSAPGCVDVTAIIFDIESLAGDPKGYESTLLFDNVQCFCTTDDADSNMELLPKPRPWDPENDERFPFGGSPLTFFDIPTLDTAGLALLIVLMTVLSFLAISRSKKYVAVSIGDRSRTPR